MYIHTHAHTHTHKHIHTHAHTQTHTHKHKHKHTHTHTHTHTQKLSLSNTQTHYPFIPPPLSYGSAAGQEMVQILRPTLSPEPRAQSRSTAKGEEKHSKAQVSQGRLISPPHLGHGAHPVGVASLHGGSRVHPQRSDETFRCQGPRRSERSAVTGNADDTQEREK